MHRGALDGHLGAGAIVGDEAHDTVVGRRRADDDVDGDEVRDDDTVAAGEAEALGEETAGSVAQLAQCRDWVRGDEEEKLATIADIRSQVNLQDSGFDAPPLSDAEAMELFDSACEAPYAQGFRLYILYARGASAAPLVR